MKRERKEMCCCCCFGLREKNQSNISFYDQNEKKKNCLFPFFCMYTIN